MKKLTISTFLALSVLAFTGAAPSFAQTTGQAQISEQTTQMLEGAFKGLSERDRIQIQSQLSEYGLYASTLDGLWGGNTANALHQAAAMMDQNMGGELNLGSAGRARAFLNQFIDGSASAFLWGEGGECDGCGENDQQESQPILASASGTDNVQRLKQAIVSACLKNARLMNSYMSTDHLGSNAFTTKMDTARSWAEIGLSVKRLGVRHVNNRWQAVNNAALVEACKEQSGWADVFGSEIQFLGKRINMRDLAYRDSATSQLSDDLTLFEKHSVAVYPLTPKETERLNGNPNDYEILGASFHLIERTACRGSQSASRVSERSSATGRTVRVVGANKSTTPISSCEEVRNVFLGGQPYDLSDQSRCFVNFHLAPNNRNVSEAAIDDPAMRAFNSMGGYAVYTEPFGLSFLYMLSHQNYQNWQDRGAWFLAGGRAADGVSKVLGSATDAFEGKIDWGKAQEQMNVTAYQYVSQPAVGRAASQIVQHPRCQAALTERRNAAASQRAKQ